MSEIDPICAMCTFDNAQEARDISKAVVKRKLAAAAQILPPIESNYYWEGEAVNKLEILVLFITKRQNFEELGDFIRLYHPYKVPEIIATPIVAGYLPYLDWVSEQTKRVR